MPYLDNISFVIIPDDATRILKLKAGEIDVAEFIPYSRVAELKADPQLNMVLFPAAQVNYFTPQQPPHAEGRHEEPAERRARAAGAELRHRQAGADPGGDVWNRHAGAELHADVHAALLRHGTALSL